MRQRRQAGSKEEREKVFKPFKDNPAGSGNVCRGRNLTTFRFGYFLDSHYASKEGISYQDIEAYCNATQNRLTIYEVNLIR